MAGIGFELKKLFGKRGFFNNIRAYFYASLVTVGPILLCVSLITVLQIVLKAMGVSFERRELFLAAIVYSFIFSLIITSGFSMVLTRYVSDRIYKKQYEYILPSLYGGLSTCLLIGGIIGGIFFFRSPLDLIFKLAAYILFMELMIIWIQAVYLTALKDYMSITKAFFTGVVITSVLTFVLIKLFRMEEVTALLVSLDVGVFTIAGFSLYFIRKSFSKSSGKEFIFISYFDKYPSLFFVGLFYSLGSYIHNFVFWAGPDSVTVGGTYVFTPIYDVPVFYAFLSIIPSMVVFVVRIETSFYEKYRKYYRMITDGGNLTDIKISKENMVHVLTQEIKYIMELQLLFAFIAMVVGMLVLPRIGLAGVSIDTFTILVFACYCNVIMLIVMLIQLYFDDRKGAIIISSTFVIGNLLFSVLTMNLGQNFYGLGFFIAAFIALIVALLRLNYFIKNIDYFTFSMQPIVVNKTKGFFSKIFDD